jgi:hypothetical protein
MISELRDRFSPEELASAEGVESLYDTVQNELLRYWRFFRGPVSEIIDPKKGSVEATNRALNGSETLKAGLLQAAELGLINTENARSFEDLWVMPLRGEEQ